MTTPTADIAATTQGHNWLAFWRSRIAEYWWLGAMPSTWRYR